MTAKHTPGPWETKPEECDKPYIRIRGTRAGARYKVANVITPVYDGIGAREAEETRANARLIAVAPDLLDVVKGFRRKIETYVSVYPGDKELRRLLSNCDAAIAKATGEPA